MPRCTHCEAHISKRFARVFADNEERVLACPDWSALAGIAEVAQTRRTSQ
jgi:hypothetical protein